MNGEQADSAPTIKDLRLDFFFRSDTLAAIREILRATPALSALLRYVLEIRVVIDASVVQAELRWRLRRRVNPSARSSLHEAIDAGVVVALAPTFLRQEIDEHVSRIAQQTGVSEAAVREQWNDFQRCLHFYEPSTTEATVQPVVDPDDLPYKNAYEELGAVAVYSRDAHFRKMEVPSIDLSLDLALRAYARASSIQMGATLSSAATLAIGVETIRALYGSVGRLVSAFKRLTPVMQMGIVAVVAGLLVWPTSRAKMVEAWQSMRNAAKKAKGPVLEVLSDFGRQVVSAALTANTTSKQIRAALPQTAIRRSALMHARMICLVSSQPLSLAEIERRMQIEGYSSQSVNFSIYLRRVLRESKQFVEVSRGLWSLKSSDQSNRQTRHRTERTE